MRAAKERIDMLEKELNSTDQHFQKEIKSLLLKNEALEADIKKMIEMQIIFKKKN